MLFLVVTTFVDCSHTPNLLLMYQTLLCVLVMRNIHPVLGGSGTRRGYRIAGYNNIIIDTQRDIEVSLGIYIGLSGYLYVGLSGYLASGTAQICWTHTNSNSRTPKIQGSKVNSAVPP